MTSAPARVCLLTALCLGIASAAVAQPPQLYRTPGLQAPVHAAAGELLQLSGMGFSADDVAVFRAMDPDAPALPAETVRAASDRHALVLRVPAGVSADRRFQIEVINRAGERSTGIFVNAALPAWFLPRALPVTGSPPGLSRDLKVVGRNLSAVAGAAGRVRLRGPRTVLLEAETPAGRSAEFAVTVRVPEGLPMGEYEVAVSGDASHWATLPTALRIEAVPAAKMDIAVADTRFGGCRGDDARDDTRCVVAALAEARRVNGARLVFAPGDWILDDVASVDGLEGFIVAEGIDLAGAGTNATRLRRGPAWQERKDAPMFTLLGRNRVSGLSFVDAAPRSLVGAAAFLQIGHSWQRNGVPVAAATTVADITIANNVFQGTPLSIRGGGLPIARLVITGNLFRAHRLALALGGDARNTRDTFRIEDAIIRANRFEPGSYLDVAIAQGARAAEFGAGERVDFSGNIADGAAPGGLDDAGDARGWRAAFFWHLQGPQEQLLIADNEITCSGDKAGDGEAIAFDNNHNTFGFSEARAVIAGDATHVAVPGQINARQGNSDIDPRSFYRGHWVQIAAGPGVGQSRRIEAVEFDAAAGRTVFTVSPAWDVVPAPRDSRITVGRSFWQALVIGNRIDHRQPPCAKSNRTAARGGVISIWGQTSDSVVAFNRQFDTNGIVFQQTFAPAGTTFQYFLEIRGNELTGDYDSMRPDGFTGIRGSHGAAPEQPPPVANFGTVIAHNSIERPMNARGAALSMPATWYRGPAPHRWPLIDRPLIYGNSINGGAGIEFTPEALVSSAVLLGNTCHTRERSARPARRQAIELCVARQPTCECGE